MNHENIPYWQSKRCKKTKRGIPPKHTKITIEHIEQIIIMHEAGRTNREIASFFNKHICSIQRLLQRKGFKAKSQSELQRKYKVDEGFFDIINTEAKAYFLGFLYADGFNDEVRKTIRVAIQKSDVEILERFKKELKSEHPICLYKGKTRGVTREYVAFSVNGKHISESLSRIGCMQAKTFLIRVPQIPKELIHHFFRGYFDGDGGISIGNKIKSNVAISITSNKGFLIDLQNILVDSLLLNKTKILQASNSKDSIGVLCYSGKNNLIKIRNWMYSDATIYLSRKKEKFYLL